MTARAAEHRPTATGGRRRATPARPAGRRAALARRVLATVGAASMLAGSTVFGGPATATPAGAATAYPAPSKQSPLLAAFYFGDASPLNVWNSDLSGAPAAFRQIRGEGFNAVALVVPWAEFQPSVSPVRYNTAAFNRLRTLVSTAQGLHLQVMLRLSYGVDVDPQDQAPDRGLTVFGDPTTYHAWLGYISKVHQAVAQFPNVKVEELSWEDFWSPIAAAANTTTPAQQIQLASQSGYLSWLQKRYSLAKVSSLYGTTFTSWSQVPTPTGTQPAFDLMFQYDDWALLHRFYEPAAARFPGLNLEARVEDDAVNSGTQQVSLHSHASTFRLPGASYIGTYFEPYQNDPSTDPSETAAQGLAALQATLSSMQTRAGGLPLYLFEYEIVSNSPEIAGQPALPAGQVPSFIQGSEPLLQQYTLGYALWTYRDYHQSPLYNPSFTLGTSGWTAQGKVRPGKLGSGGAVTLAAGASVSQPFPVGQLSDGDGAPVTVSFRASAPGSAPVPVTVTVGSGPAETVSVQGTAAQAYQVQVPAASVGGAGGGRLSIAAPSGAVVSDVQAYSFTQSGDVLSTTGTPEVGAAPLLTLNQQLVASASHASKTVGSGS